MGFFPRDLVEVAARVGIAEHITSAAFLPVASFTGMVCKPGTRIPARAWTYGDAWGQIHSARAIDERDWSRLWTRKEGLS